MTFEEWLETFTEDDREKLCLFDAWNAGYQAAAEKAERQRHIDRALPGEY